MGVLKNPKHERFAQEIAKGKTAAEAFATAGYTPNEGNAARLKGNDKVLKRIEEILSKAAEKVGLSIERTLEEIVRLAFADIGQAVEWTKGTVTLKDSTTLPPEVRAAISEVKQTKDGVAIKFHSKTAALDMLGKHFGLFKERIEMTGKDGGPVQVEPVAPISDIDLARQMAFILERGRRAMLKENAAAKQAGETPHKP